MTRDEIEELFHPLVARWFGDSFSAPTDIQAQAWPCIAGGKHVLLTAPTGSGKTLTAFLWALNQLLRGEWPDGGTRVLYVSPLKALNNDIQRNLIRPLNELRDVFEKAGEPFPEIRALTRSGDTPQIERQRMIRRPPEILITTPESLNLMLSSHGGRSLLGGLRTVILDEIHAVAGTKRGVYLMSAVDRLVRLSGEFQRIAISATVKPMDRVAAFVGGLELDGLPEAPVYTSRPVATLQSSANKVYDFKVIFPESAANKAPEDKIWEPLVDELKAIIHENRSTLIFTNSRALSEKITLKINAGEPELLAYAHHGSLSREIRTTVEARLKAGDLKAIVATTSLEMGIDIGALDEVVLLQAPLSVSSTIQRLGRAGHQVGEASRGRLFPTHSHDFLEAAVLADAVQEREIEAVRPVECPLDVLAQVIVSMTVTETWDIDELFAWIRTSHPYRDLQRNYFDLVLNMLAGKYADTRIRELKPRVSIDAIDGTVRARKGAAQTLYFSGGVIPDRGHFALRLNETHARIGELDEEFVWEATVGQTFTLGSQAWRIERITHNDVLVRPGSPKAVGVPFWRGEVFNRDFHFSERIGEFLEAADERLGESEFRQELEGRHRMNDIAAGELVRFLRRQKEQTGCALPHRRHVVVEQVAAGPGGAPGHQIVLHTFWGGRVNRPLALALAAAWKERIGERIEIHAGNDCIALVLQQEVDGAELLSMVTPSNVESLLRDQLENSGFFAGRFRECAGRALLVTRQKLSQRLPLWLSRLKSQKLLEAVMDLPDFPILLETWRECLRDEFDLENLRRVLTELETSGIAWTQARTQNPSPFAQGVAFEQINDYMYRQDEPAVGAVASNLSEELLKELVFGGAGRPAIPEELAREFEAKRQRTAPGYSPASAEELLDWAKERGVIPAPEWGELGRSISLDHGGDLRSWRADLGDKLMVAEEYRAVVARERLDAYESLRDCRSLEANSAVAGLIRDWISFYGPRPVSFLADTMGVDAERASDWLAELESDRSVVVGELTDGADGREFCDAANLETLLRWRRAAERPVFEPLEAKWLPVFLAQWQGVIGGDDREDALVEAMERMVCLPAAAGLWESEILPARKHRYRTAELDAALNDLELDWVGTGEREVAFCFEDELDLLGPAQDTESATGDLEELFPDARARYDFGALLSRSDSGASKVAERLWSGVWAGRVTNDSFAALRTGIQNNFKADIQSAPQTARQRRRRGFGGRVAMSKWKGSLPFAGNWRLLEAAGEPDQGRERGDESDNETLDPLELAELNKERVRILLDRCGILFRELLQREAPAFRWASVFRTLRLMELSGELLSGCFFTDIQGPQFISHQAFRELKRGLPDNRIFWLNACDPISLCGVSVDSLKGGLPRRIPGNHIVYRGAEIAVVSQRQGKALTINLEPDDPDLPECLGVISHLLQRDFQPLKRIKVETINDEPAVESDFADLIGRQFDAQPDGGALTLYRRV